MTRDSIKGFRRIFNDRAIVKMISAGHIRAYVGWQFEIEQLTQKGGPNESDLIFVRPIFDLAYGSCISRKNEKADLIQQKLNEGFAYILSSGEYDALLQSYGKHRSQGN